MLLIYRRLPELNLRIESDIKIDNTVSHVIKCGSSWDNIYANGNDSKLSREHEARR